MLKATHTLLEAPEFNNRDSKSKLRLIVNILVNEIVLVALLVTSSFPEKE